MIEDRANSRLLTVSVAASWPDEKQRFAEALLISCTDQLLFHSVYRTRLNPPPFVALERFREPGAAIELREEGAAFDAGSCASNRMLHVAVH